MLCNVNDTVIYGSDGICRVTGVSKRSRGGVEEEYYVLKPIYDQNSTIYAPMNNEKIKSKMRRVLTEKEIYALIKSMPDEDTIWIENEHERHMRYKSILMSGDRTGLIKLIKTLRLCQETQREKGRKMHVADERIMQQAERMLHGEFAHVLNISNDQVLSLITEQIEADNPDPQ